jgi:isochorismate pyruvate lyase
LAAACAKVNNIRATYPRQERYALLEAVVMTNYKIKSPSDCADMADVRAGVDATDIALVGLLARRFGYMEAAARIKTDRAAVRDEARKAAVIANAIAEAERVGVPADIIAKLWELLVETSIAHEMAKWDSLRG